MSPKTSYTRCSELPNVHTYLNNLLSVKRSRNTRSSSQQLFLFENYKFLFIVVERCDLTVIKGKIYLFYFYLFSFRYASLLELTSD